MRIPFLSRLLVLLLLLPAAPGLAATGSPAPVHAISMHGAPKYPPGFTSFDYVNPDAPQGGTVRLGTNGAFDTLNPYTIRGLAAASLALTYDTLLEKSADEPFTGYGLLAESIQLPEDRSEVTFTLRPEATWSDGTPVSAEDVAFSLETLRTKGLPFYNAYYGDVASVEVLGPRTVRFVFRHSNNRELPLIIGQMPILPKHYWESRDFEAVTLEIPVHSGPYAIETFEPGRSITYRRRADYWGNGLPVMRGRYNFERIEFTSYRDATVMLEAFKAGAFDFRLEYVARQWATGYQSPALNEGRIILERIPNHRVSGMQGFVFNLRNPLFKDPAVREALAYTFDFEWTNKTLFFNEYKRLRSYFDNSELAATGLPSPAEMEVLAPLRTQIPERVFTESYQPPSVDPEAGGMRANLGKAMELLKSAGWTVRDGALRNSEGTPFTFEILLVQPEFDRIVVPMTRNMERLGIKATIRVVDSAQYVERVQKFDYDMMVTSWGQSNSPGNEQRNYWSCQAASTPGSSNEAGLCSPAVDTLIEGLIGASTREDLVARTRALDRVLQWSFLVIPQYYVPADRVAYWNIFGRPEITPEDGVQFFTWWIDPAKAAALGRRGSEK
ncbi:ABC transporter substrate-binding protein [Phaeovibrio sulfidiphilus]|uniref:ABC transporter substrate-binding protein n=1 Tax=Phaeovibrio sulfidiphilus TaxID=1220600 RepID=A0A8J7CRL6_9PROT|nr:extracellular solute-binding protein [Phaeovibrio sulfidiphilus]MBE1237695.1 ABC transporter substrate-binding protein [Phaeovibrio sulfidiphilus]